MCTCAHECMCTCAHECMCTCAHEWGGATPAVPCVRVNQSCRERTQLGVASVNEASSSKAVVHALPTCGIQAAHERLHGQVKETFHGFVQRAVSTGSNSSVLGMCP
eukprot:366440-Chlamydomonas_euryale.AAC.9